MGYTTEFEGKFKLNKKLDEETYQFLVKLNETRRMARNVGPEYGVEGEFYVEDDGLNVISYNQYPKTQPGLWCQWAPTACGEFIEWDEGEKFYNYIEWLEYLLQKVLIPKGYHLNGDVEYQGEADNDYGVIIVENDKIIDSKGSTLNNQTNEVETKDFITTVKKYFEIEDENITQQDLEELLDHHDVDSVYDFIEHFYNVGKEHGATNEK